MSTAEQKTRRGGADGKAEATTEAVRASAVLAVAAAQGAVPLGKAVPVDLLEDNPYQPRLTYDDAKFAELVASIRKDGLLQPIVVRPVGRGFQIIAGHRRARAFRKLKDDATVEAERDRWSTVPALVREQLSDEELARLALNENLQREELLPMEAAAALVRYKEAFGLKSARDVAQATGLKEDRVKRLLRLNEMPTVVKEAVVEGLKVELPFESKETPPDGTVAKPRTERRRVDLMSALELGRLHRRYSEASPAKADERVRKLTERFLSEGWGLRRLQKYVEGQLHGADGAATEDAAVEAVSKPPTPPAFGYRDDGKTLVIQREHLGLLTVGQREWLRANLKQLLTTLA